MSIEELKKYKCDDYGKNFTQIIGLKGLITYYMKKRFNCDECGKYFYSESNLRMQIQIVHKKDF